MQNYDEETGCFYGYISAKILDPELVDTLMFGVQATDNSYLASLDQIAFEAGARKDHIDKTGVQVWIYEGEEFWIEDLMDHLNVYDIPTIDERDVSGEYEGITYQSSWMGGALCFFIIDSPVQVNTRECSPCVPNAGNLDNYYEDHCYDGVYCHGVHSWWLGSDV